MKNLVRIVGMGMILCMVSACGKKDGSPRIVCDLDGTIVATTYTFAEFRQTLAAEHGQVEATGQEQLKTRSLVVSFKPLENGTLLAERALILRSGKTISPAVLFGLTKTEQPGTRSDRNTPGPGPAATQK